MPKLKTFQERWPAPHDVTSPPALPEPEMPFSPGDLSDLPPKQRVALVNVLCGHGDAYVAQLIGATRQTVCNWRQDPRFQAHLQAVRGDVNSMLRDRLSNVALKALDVLNELLASRDDRIRLAAAKAVTRSLSIQAPATTRPNEPKPIVTELIRRTEL